MKTSLLILSLVGVAALWSCRGSKTSEEKSPGEASFRNNCQTCHRLPNPSDKTDSEWPPLVRRYGDRARLTDRQAELILKYLLAAN